MKRLLIAMACSLLWIAPAHAQTCRGALTFQDAPTRWGVNGNFSSNTHGVEAGVARGYDQFFAGGGLVLHGVSDLGTAKGVFGGVGAEYPLGPDKKYFACPTVGLFKTWGASGFDNGSASNLLLNFGGTVGFEAGKAGHALVVPTAGIGLNYIRASDSDGAGNDFTATDTFFAIQVGVGLIFNNRMSLTPSLILPLSSTEEITFAAVFTMKLGK